MDEKEDRGSLAAWALRHHHRRIYRYLLRKTGDPGRAEELTQEVFADAVPALERFRQGQTPVLALLQTIAKRRFADDARREARASSVSLDALAEEPRAPEHDPALAAALARAILHLPAGQSSVAAMKLIQGRSFAEIAHELAITEDACKKRFLRALRSLRAEFTQEGFEP